MATEGKLVRSLPDAAGHLDPICDAVYTRLAATSPPERLLADLHVEVERIACRSVPTVYLHNRQAKLERYRQQLAHLRTLHVVAQRSPEWYAMRHERLTASDLAQAIGKGKFGSQRDFYVKKAGYEDKPFNHAAPPLKWGTMYEPVANDLYTRVKGVRVHEFGLIPHPTIGWFGCSPDGITEDGIMLEIKCPYKRKIDGHVPEQYALQIQGQLEVCSLSECDYLEVELREYATVADFEQEADPLRYKGIVLERRMPDGGGYEYRYSPFGASADHALTWVEQQGDFDFGTIHSWYVHKYNIIRVYHDQGTLDAALAQAERSWETVLGFRADRQTYDNYMTKKQSRPGKAAVEKPNKFQVQLDDYAFLE